MAGIRTNTGLQSQTVIALIGIVEDAGHYIVIFLLGHLPSRIIFAKKGQLAGIPINGMAVAQWDNWLIVISTKPRLKRPR